jgi:hypothetical protein
MNHRWMNHRPPRPSRGPTYEQTLRDCARVAEEEFGFASQTLVRAGERCRELESSLHAISSRPAPSGSAVQQAQAKLKEVELALATRVTRALTDGQRRLNLKQQRLSRFTVTLFGRTMAGKSTIREALTQGDGSTIGKGGQRTTRKVHEYLYEGLSVIDTPGFGAFEGQQDTALAFAAVEASDLVIFLLSSDSIQEDAFRAMQELRAQNKPVLFVLNVKRDLGKTPSMLRRFLADPSTVFKEEELRGHEQRIRDLAGDVLGMRDLRIVPIHAQAAFLSTRDEHREVAEQLFALSRLGEVRGALVEEVLRRGRVRRVQTLVDGTSIALLDLRQELNEQARTLEQNARHLATKLVELEGWISGFVRATRSRFVREASTLLHPLRDGVSAFVDENLESGDLGTRWKHWVGSLGLDGKLQQVQEDVLDELRAQLMELTREFEVEARLGAGLNIDPPTSFDPHDFKRSLGWASATAGALGGIAFALSWNPVGWAAAGVSLVLGIFAWLADDREPKLQKEKQRATQVLRERIDALAQEIAGTLGKWFERVVLGEHVATVRRGTKTLVNGLSEAAVALRLRTRQLDEEIERLDRRLFLRTAELLGAGVDDRRLGRVVRDPGMRAKLDWLDAVVDARFCRVVGDALGERVVGVGDGPLSDRVAAALRPAQVEPTAVCGDKRRVLVRLHRDEIGKAKGKHGANVSLASRLLGMRIDIVEESHG